MQIAKRTDPSYKECHYTINPSKSITFYTLFRNSFMEKYQLVNLTTVQPLSAYLRLWAYIFKHPFKPLAEPHERVSQKYFTYLPPLSTFDSLFHLKRSTLHLDREHTYNKKLLWGKWAGFFRPFPRSSCTIYYHLFRDCFQEFHFYILRVLSYFCLSISIF